jgi:hypothetical protein
MGTRRTRAGVFVAAIAFDQAKRGYLANSVVVGGVRSSVRPRGQLMR